MSEELVNQITLNCLMNKNLYEKYLSDKTSKTLENEEERKLYRKRIYVLTKELLLNKEEPTDLLPDIKTAFDYYVKSCIHYFKIIDHHKDLDDDQIVENTLQKEKEEEAQEFEKEKEKEEKHSLSVRSIPLFHPPNLDTFLLMNSNSQPNKNKMGEKENINLL